MAEHCLAPPQDFRPHRSGGLGAHRALSLPPARPSAAALLSALLPRGRDPILWKRPLVTWAFPPLRPAWPFPPLGSGVLPINPCGVSTDRRAPAPQTHASPVPVLWWLLIPLPTQGTSPGPVATNHLPMTSFQPPLGPGMPVAILLPKSPLQLRQAAGIRHPGRGHPSMGQNVIHFLLRPLTTPRPPGQASPPAPNPGVPGSEEV